MPDLNSGTNYAAFLALPNPDEAGQRTTRDKVYATLPRKPGEKLGKNDDKKKLSIQATVADRSGPWHVSRDRHRDGACSPRRHG